MAALLFFTSFFSLCTMQTQAQTLKTDHNVPALSACGDYEEFQLSIGSGAAACTATLEIVMPEHFLYEVGSAKIDGVTADERDATEAGASISLNIPAGTPEKELVITFNAKATCEAIGTVDLPTNQRPAVAYTLNGCGAASLTGESEAINIAFAVLNLTITPEATQGVIGDEFTRTIEVRNSGNGYVKEFTVTSALGADLELVSHTASSVANWIVDASNPGVYVFSDFTLNFGETISFTETVKMKACGDTNTEYNAYYGCTDRCTISDADDTKKAFITLDTSIRPIITTSLVDVQPSNYCFDQDYTVVIEIKNTGTGTAGNILYSARTPYDSSNQYGSTHVVGDFKLAGDVDFTDFNSLEIASSVPMTGANTKLYGTHGKFSSVAVNIDELKPGETVYLSYKMRNNLPVDGCENGVSKISYGGIIRARESSYKNKSACDPEDPKNTYTLEPITYPGRGSITSDFSGFNTGSLDAYDGDPFEGRFRMDSFTVF